MNIKTFKDLRERSGMTQREFGEYLNFSPRSITRYEKKEREPVFTVGQVKRLTSLLKRLNLKLTDLPDKFSQ
jgi:transcriptional regulator with XRE-family HTH domain